MVDELVEKRTRNSKTYDLGGRKRRCVIHGSDIHYKDSTGHWQDIDANYFETDGDGFTAKFTKLPYTIRMGDDGKRCLYPDRNDLSYWVEIGKAFTNMGMPIKQGGYWVWDYPNSAISLRIANSGIKLNFTLKNSNAPTSISFPFATQGITRNGKILLHNGKPVVILARPHAVDAEGTERDVDISFGGGEVMLSLDTSELVFPIDIDPTELVVQPSAKDTRLRETSPNSSYGDQVLLTLRDKPGEIARIMQEFDISGLPVGATLNSASFQLYYYNYAAIGNIDPVGKTVWAYKLTRTDWIEGVYQATSTAGATWIDYKIVDTTHYPWTNAGGDYVTSDPSGGSTVLPADHGWMSWGVLAIVQDAYDNSNPAEFLLKFEDEGLADNFSEADFYPKEYTTDPDLQPKLVIDYTPAVVDVTIDVPLATISCQAVAPTPSLGVTLSPPVALVNSLALVPTVEVTPPAAGSRDSSMAAKMMAAGVL